MLEYSTVKSPKRNESGRTWTKRLLAIKNSSLTVIEAVRFINIKFTIHEHSGNRRKYSIKVLRMEFVK